MLSRDHWLKQIHRLDPEKDFLEIYRISSFHEFPWDTVQALGFALYRTYAVPSIGRLLLETGEFTARPQKRYDDTTLILDAVMEHGFDSAKGREALRRMNQMHRHYPISNDDFRYVLSTFVVVPKRWLDDYGWRTYTDHELRALTMYYRTLGRHMGIQDIPETYPEFEQLLDAYEREHFAFDEGGRAVSDATLDLFASWYPGPAGALLRRASVCLLDDSLRDAFGYPVPSPALTAFVRRGLRFRARVLRAMPARREPFYARQGPNVRGYKNGYRLSDLGTFPGGATGCPVPHDQAPHDEQAAPLAE